MLSDIFPLFGEQYFFYPDIAETSIFSLIIAGIIPYIVGDAFFKSSANTSDNILAGHFQSGFSPTFMVPYLVALPVMIFSIIQCLKSTQHPSHRSSIHGALHIFQLRLAEIDRKSVV